MWYEWRKFMHIYVYGVRLCMQYMYKAYVVCMCGLWVMCGMNSVCVVCMCVYVALVCSVWDVCV